MDIITYPEMPTKENQWSWNFLEAVIQQIFGGISLCIDSRCGGQTFETTKAAHNSYARCPLGCERETTGEIAAACSFL